MQMNAIYLALVVPALAMLRGTGDHTLVSDMRPEVVRKLLSNVEQKWIHTRAMVLSNATDDNEAFHEMQGSCVTVSSAIVAGSEGQRDRVIEYMQDVCTDTKGLCSSFASGIEDVMTDDSEFNRDELHLSQFCRKFWDSAVTSAAQAEAKEQAEKAEEERKEKEEAAKKAAEAAKKAAEEAEKERVERLRIQTEEAAKQKAAEDAAKQKAAEEAAQVKAYEAQQESNSTTNQTSQASSSVQESSASPTSSASQTGNASVASSQADAIVASTNEAAQVNNTVAPQSSDANQTNTDSTGSAPQTSSTSNGTSVPAAVATQNKTNPASIAMIARSAVKNATAMAKKALL